MNKLRAAISRLGLRPRALAGAGAALLLLIVALVVYWDVARGGDGQRLAGDPAAAEDALPASATAQQPEEQQPLHTLSNNTASPQAQQVYSWLAGLPERDEQRLIIGHFGGYSDSTFGMAQTNELAVQTGELPGMLSCDYGKGWDIAPYITDVITYGCNQGLIEYSQLGGLVTVSLHLPSPAYHNGGHFRELLPTEEMEQLVDGQTEIGARWRDVLDAIADGLQELRDAGVVTLFRPFHEMNGDWFWWCATGYNALDERRAAAFRSMWRHMYDYFADERGLDNLIWVYAPDANREHKTAYYPGEDYADIAGLDAYVQDPRLVAGYTEMLALGKPFAFTEIGPQVTDGTFNYGQWIDAIREKYTQAVYVLAWNDTWGPGSNEGADKLMTDPLVMPLSIVREQTGK